MDKSGLSVIVIGAGAAGLTAAKELIKAGCVVLVLEAHSTPGGRIKTLTLSNGHEVDVGASLIHDRNQTLYARAKAAGKLSEHRPKVGYLVDGRLKGLWSIVWMLSFSDFIKLSRLFKNFYAYEGEDAPITKLVDKIAPSTTFKRLFGALNSIAIGAKLDRVGIRALRHSFKAAGLKVEKDFTSIEVKGSIRDLLKDEIDTVLPYIKFNQTVTAIDYSSDRVRVRINDSKEFEADKVIVTVPLAILKNERIMFSPSLPEAKQQAIQSLGMGQGFKVVFEFSERFWPGRYTYLIDADLPAMYFIKSFEKGPFVLIAFMTDDELAKQEDAVIKTTLLQSLDTAFSGNASKYLLSAFLQNWSRDEHISGTFSYDAVGSEGARDELAQIIIGRLYFAGEATINGYATTVDGAMMSGMRAAREIGI